MKKFSVDPRDFLESDIHWLPSKIVSRISNIAGNLLNDEWESGIVNVYHESYVENEKIILEFDDDSLSGWQEFGIFDKFKKCCKKAFQLYLEGLLKEEIKNTDDICNLEKKISEIMDSVDSVKDSEKKSNSKTELYCNNCKMRFVVPDDKCKIAFDGLEANVRKYYRCPKCTKICWCNND